MTVYAFGILERNSAVKWSDNRWKTFQRREVMTNHLEGDTRIICLAPTIKYGSQIVTDPYELRHDTDAKIP
jgi:hypothetical protein